MDRNHHGQLSRGHAARLRSRFAARRVFSCIAAGLFLFAVFPSVGTFAHANGGGGSHQGGGGHHSLPALPLPEVRTIDGTQNSLLDPNRGAAETPFRRLTPTAYGDGMGSPSGANRPSARLISNVVCDQASSTLNARGASDFLWQWGQFLDHDIDETPLGSPPEPFDIPVPFGDPFFDPAQTGLETIPLDRSFFTLEGGVRQQENLITAYIDGSNVYGSDAARATELRKLDGSGRLKTSSGHLLPFNVNAFENAPTAFDPSFFLAGDVRANEQVALTAMHTLFVREHNYWAKQFSDDFPHLTGDQIYERARAVVGAELQYITYAEFLPVLLGENAMPPYAGYNPSVDASISNEFATASFRVGHTLLSPTLLRLKGNGDPIPAGHLPLADGFFIPQEILDHGIEPLLRGLAEQRAQEVDPFVIDAVRNFLFGAPGAGGFDLASLNIQRGRDHGLAGYAAVRSALGLSPVTSVTDISSNPEVQSRLAAAYPSVDQIDLWLGGLCEDHLPGAMVGETIAAILTEQFIALRDGDRFWYAHALPPEWVSIVESQSLSKIIRRNTSIGSELRSDVFRMPGNRFVRGDCDGSGSLNLTDAIGLLLHLFNGGSLGCKDAGDIDDNGTLNISDPIALLSALFAGGAPPSSPYPSCGMDVSVDTLDCALSGSGCP